VALDVSHVKIRITPLSDSDRTSEGVVIMGAAIQTVTHDDPLRRHTPGRVGADITETGRAGARPISKMSSEGGTRTRDTTISADEVTAADGDDITLDPQ
jgi:hypothetical protein